MLPLIGVSLAILIGIFGIVGGIRMVSKASRTSLDLVSYAGASEAGTTMMANFLASGAYLSKTTLAPTDPSSIDFDSQMSEACNLARAVMPIEMLRIPKWGINARRGLADSDLSTLTAVEGTNVVCGTSASPLGANLGLQITVLKKGLTTESPFYDLLHSITDSNFGGLDFEIVRLHNDHLPQVPILRIRTTAFPIDGGKLMAQRNSVFHEASYIFTLPSVMTHSLILPGRLRMDSAAAHSTMGATATNHSRGNTNSAWYQGDGVIPYVTAAERSSYKGITFLSPVFANFGAVLPAGDTLGAVAKIDFLTALRFGNGTLMKQGADGLENYQPSEMGNTLGGSLNDLAHYLGSMDGTADYNHEDETLSKLYGIKAIGAINSLSNMCSEDQKWIDAETSSHSELVVQSDVARGLATAPNPVANTISVGQKTFTFHNQGPIGFFTSWTGQNRFVKQDNLFTSATVKMAAKSPAQGGQDGTFSDCAGNACHTPDPKDASAHPLIRIMFAVQEPLKAAVTLTDGVTNWWTADLTAPAASADTATATFTSPLCTDLTTQIENKNKDIEELAKEINKQLAGKDGTSTNFASLIKSASDYVAAIDALPPLPVPLPQLYVFGKNHSADTLPGSDDALITYVNDNLIAGFNPTMSDKKKDFELPDTWCDKGVAGCTDFQSNAALFLQNVYYIMLGKKNTQLAAELTTLLEKDVYVKNPTQAVVTVNAHKVNEVQQQNTMDLTVSFLSTESFAACEPPGSSIVMIVQGAERGSDRSFGHSEGRKLFPITRETATFNWVPVDIHPTSFTTGQMPVAFQTLPTSTLQAAAPDLTKDYHSGILQCFTDSTPAVSNDYSNYAQRAWNFTNLTQYQKAADAGGVAKGQFVNSNLELVLQGQTISNFVTYPETFVFPINAGTAPTSANPQGAHIKSLTIAHDTTFVTGFYVVDELIIEGGRDAELTIVATIVAKSLNIDKQALQFGIRWMSPLSPNATALLQKANVLGRGLACNNLRDKNLLAVSPGWQGNLRLFGSALPPPLDPDGIPYTNKQDISKQMVMTCIPSFLAPRLLSALSSSSMMPIGIPGVAETEFDVTNYYRGLPGEAILLSTSSNVTMGR